MNFLLIIIIIAIILISYFSFSSKFGKVRKKYSQGIDFYFTLIATIIGVVLALYFSNLVERNKDKQFAIDMLEIAKSNVDQNIERNESNITFYHQVSLDSLNVSVNPLVYPLFSENVVLSDSKLSQHISQETYKSLLSKFETSKRMKKLFHSYTFKKNSAVAEQYNLFLKLTSQELALEIEYQKNNLSIDQMEKERDSLNKRLTIELGEIVNNPLIEK